MKLFLTFSAYFLTFLASPLFSQLLAPDLSRLPAFLETLEDANNDGFADYFDFFSQKRENFARNSLKLKENELIAVFSRADRNKDGLLSKSEWKRFYQAEFLEFFVKCDENRDFLIQISEFRRCFLERSLNSSKNFETFFELSAKFEEKLTFLQALRLRDAAVSWKICTNATFSAIKLQEFLCMFKLCFKELQVLEHKLEETLFFLAKRLTKRSLQGKSQGESLEFASFWNLCEKFAEFSRLQRFLNANLLEKSKFRDISEESYGFSADFAEFFVMKE